MTDPALLGLRLIAGAIYADSGYNDIRDPDKRSKDIGMPKGFTIVLAVAELAGGAGLILGVFQQLAAMGLILIMLGAIQKKLMVWKTGSWGDQSPGWYYEVSLIFDSYRHHCDGWGQAGLLTIGEVLRRLSRRFDLEHEPSAYDVDRPSSLFEID